MAAIATANATILYSEGSGERTVLYRVKQVDTGDTLDVSGQFTEVKLAVWGPAGDLATGVVATFAGTVITFTLATMADDNIYLLVIGQGA